MLSKKKILKKTVLMNMINQFEFESRTLKILKCLSAVELNYTIIMHVLRIIRQLIYQKFC